MASYKVPRHIALVEDLPRNAAGKVLKIDLARI
jgi:acyl-CoA synthetase (AMP-forming)/AMP-acid ligase II